MRVAFDVKGTLSGPDKILELYKWFKSKGCTMVVWSGMYSYATDMAEKLDELGIPADEVTDKVDRQYFDDGESEPFVDVAIDDADFLVEGEEILPFLSCGCMIPVNDVPEDPAQFEEKFGVLFSKES